MVSPHPSSPTIGGLGAGSWRDENVGPRALRLSIEISRPSVAAQQIPALITHRHSGKGDLHMHGAHNLAFDAGTKAVSDVKSRLTLIVSHSMISSGCARTREKYMRMSACSIGFSRLQHVQNPHWQLIYRLRRSGGLPCRQPLAGTWGKSCCCLATTGRHKLDGMHAGSLRF